ncbi:DUF6197 family protein [Streptomyces sp. 5.8]|uniref:DUF6197 family protein n=1 Tax=Streptomyces sp. 5.8 TaxID=3406571 RepID=UPI003BB7E334
MPSSAPLTTDHPTATATSPSPKLTFEERLTLINSEMTLRLDQAAVAYEVNTAHIDTEPLDLADVVTIPLTPTLQPPTPYPTPVAALLQRAHHRLLTAGWCTGRLVDAEGARCMLGAIGIEARGDGGLQDSAVSVLLHAIQRTFGEHIDSVPAFNDSWATSRIPARMVAQAATLADARGL